MLIEFKSFFNRVVELTPIKTQTELSKALDINRSAITQAKVRDAVPEKWALSLAIKYNISPELLLFGKNYASNKNSNGSKLQDYTQDLIAVPHVEAALCAGGGSFITGEDNLNTYMLPEKWLRQIGQPNSLVFMDVMGDSMEPNIHDGDVVLIDRSKTYVSNKNVFAVGVDDALYVKRIEQQKNTIVLYSDNPKYTPMVLSSDELNSFRLIGQVVWLCRNI